MKSRNARDMASVIVSGKSPNSIKGVGFVELLLTVALVSLTVGIATPLYHDAVEKQRIIGAAEQVASFVSAAKSESIRLGKQVVVSYGNQCGRNWWMGATIGKRPCDCAQTSPEEPGYCTIASSSWLLRDTDIHAENSISTDSGDGSFTFDPVRGILVDPSDDVVLSLHAGQGHFQMKLHMMATGRTSLCRQSASEEAEWVEICSPVARQF